jgi:cell division protein FtsB
MGITQKQNTDANEVQTESIVKKVMTSEIKYIIGILLFLGGVIAPYYSIRQDIALIKQNHLMHIENMQKEIEETKNEIKDLKSVEIQLMQTISERLPK